MIPKPKVFENSNLNDADLLIQLQVVRAVNALLALHGLDKVDWLDENDVHVREPSSPQEEIDRIHASDERDIAKRRAEGNAS
jgi:hypothetical protein